MQPGEYASFRRRCLAQDVSKGGELGRRIESSHKARITLERFALHFHDQVWCNVTETGEYSEAEFSKTLEKLSVADRRLLR